MAAKFETAHVIDPSLCTLSPTLEEEAGWPNGEILGWLKYDALYCETKPRVGFQFEVSQPTFILAEPVL